MKREVKLLIWGMGITLIVSVWGLEKGSRILLAPSLRVEDVEVNGCHLLEHQQILDAAAVPPRAPILKLELKEIAWRVESLPWVRSCEVRRILPNKLSFRIVERRPVALIHIGKLYYLDEDGTPFKEPSPGETLNYPILTGWEDQWWETSEGKELIQEALGLLKEVPNYPHLCRQGVSEIHLNETGELTIFTEKRGTMIILGRLGGGFRLRKLEEVWKWIITRYLPVKYILCECPDRIVVGL
jgi:cell division protein FtsQ